MICKHFVFVEYQPGRCDLRDPLTNKATEILEAWKETVVNAGGQVGGLGGLACGRGICCFAMTKEYSTQKQCPQYEVQNQ